MIQLCITAWKASESPSAKVCQNNHGFCLWFRRPAALLSAFRSAASLPEEFSIQSTLDFAPIFIEFGALIIGLAVLSRISRHWSFSSIPLYLIAGLMCGDGSLIPLNLSKNFIQAGAEMGVLLLLFMLGLEYSGEQLKQNLKSGVPAVALDFLLNFPPGLLAGLLLGWKPIAAVLLGGVTFVSSSSIIARLLAESGRMKNPETPIVLSILVLEDLVMAVFLPVMAVFIAGGTPSRIAISLAFAILSTTLVFFVAIRYGRFFNDLLAHQSDETILLSVFGSVLLVSGLVERLHISAAIGAFLVGIAVSGPIAEQSHRLLSPLHDLLAAIFFFFFGLEIDPRSLPPVLLVALALVAITTATKILTGYGASHGFPLCRRTRIRTGLTLIAHGEFSIVIAGLGVAIEPRLGPLAAAYVLLMAIGGPIAARVIR
jgi:CPA2 family monovalent cation:H+ antiporter-2